MSAKSQPEDRRHRSAGDEVLHRLDDLNGSLMDRIDDDHRFQSGVPEDQRATDLEFILMSGLTRPASDDLLLGANPSPVVPGNMSRSLSFFEQGVADVDDLMAPSTIDSRPVNDEVLDAPPARTHEAARGESNIVEMHEVVAAEKVAAPPDANRIEELEVRLVSPPPDLDKVFEEILVPIEQDARHLSDLREPDPDELEDAPEMAAMATPDTDDVARQEAPASGPELPPSAPAPSENAFTSETDASSVGGDDEVSRLIDHYLRSARRAEPEPPAAAEHEVTPEPVLEAEPAQPDWSEPPAPMPVEEDAPALVAGGADVLPAVEPEHTMSESPVVADLAAAEMLLQALESQPRDMEPPISRTIPEPVSPAESAEPVSPAESVEPEEPEAFEFSESESFAGPEESPEREQVQRHSGRTSRRSHSRARRRTIRLIWTGVAAAVGLAVLAGGYVWLQSMLMTPEARFAEAQELASAGMYSQASAAFASFAAANERHSSRSEAQFLGALYARMTPTRDFDEEQVVAQRALTMFEEFLRDNPTHPKAPRAWTMVAQLHYELGQYQEAVNILRDPTLRMRDAESALPGLRTLARSYVRLGEHAAAESAYQQAAARAGNITPDADYDELGDLFKLRADRADDVQEARRLRESAIESWAHAIRVPGIDPANKAKIQDKKKWLESQLGESQAPAAVPAGAEPTAEAVAPASSAVDAGAGAVVNVVPLASPAPPAAAVSMDPEAEARFLSGSPGAETAQ